MLRLNTEYKLPEKGFSDIYDAKWYRGILKAVRGAKPELEQLDITVVLVDNPKIRELNTAYRGLSKVTDVLSFRYDDGEGEDSGELFISLPVAEVQAKRYRVTLQKEMARLVIHGMFHLFGYDHVKTPERVVMRALEKSAMSLAKQAKLY